MEDLDAIEAVEAACFPPAEAASNESLTARVAAYPDHFWLLVNTDDDDTPFPSRVEAVSYTHLTLPTTERV